MNENKTEVFQELIKRSPNFLDRPLAELLPMRFMGEVAVNAYRGLIARLDDLPLSLEEKESRLRDGQDAGRALLTIEARIGELYKAIPDRMKPKGSSVTKKEEIAGDNKSAKRKHFEQAKIISEHPAEVEEVIKEAEENEDIPTKTAVLNKIAYKKELARQKDKREKTQFEMKGEAFIYYTKLEQALSFIPTTPPCDLMEKDYLRIKAIALLIIKRLEVFQDGTTTKSLPGTN